MMAKIERVTMDDVPSMPSSGKWVWKDESQSLEFINSGGGDKGSSNRRLAARQGTFIQDVKNLDRRTPSAGMRPYSMGVGRGYNRERSPKPGPGGRKDGQTEEDAVVTLDIIKSVAHDMLSKVQQVSPHFEHLFMAEQLDDFLMSLLRYFNFFFDKRTQDNKPNPMNIEPSKKELAEYEEICQKLEASQKVVGKAYCTLILGIGLTDHHHMHGGSSRVSATYTDRAMFETFYAFCTFVIWVTFKRKEYDVIREEVGRVLRSETFNPAIRVKNFNPKYDENGKLIPEPKISPAEYRRLHPKRPAIKTMINQRSPALVSILPSPKEDAGWLFNRRKGYSTAAFGDNEPDEDEDADASLATMKLGILGDNLNLYNAQLAPKGAENEEEEGEDEEGQGSDADGKTEEPSARPVGATSRATTAGLTERE